MNKIHVNRHFSALSRLFGHNFNNLDASVTTKTGMLCAQKFCNILNFFVEFGMAKVFLMLMIVMASVCSASKATAADSALVFDKQLSLLNVLAQYAERPDYARLVVVQKSVENVKNDILNNEKNGKNEITFQTLRLIQNLIIQYRFSQVFFGWTNPPAYSSIYTDATANEIKELYSLYQQVVNEYGYDDSPYTQITANTFRQMHKLLQDLEKLPLKANMKSQLRALWQPIGSAIAIAEQGDRPNAFKAAMPVIEKVRSLYPLFDTISASETGFTMIMELQGLNEFYAEYAQMK